MMHVTGYERNTTVGRVMHMAVHHRARVVHDRRRGGLVKINRAASGKFVRITVVAHGNAWGQSRGIGVWRAVKRGRCLWYG